MRYLLDANIVIKLALGTGPGELRARAGACGENDLVTSAIVLAEVVYGSINRKPPPLEQLARFLEEVPVLAFDDKAALAYARLPFKRASYDRLIAAHAMSQGLVVVTDNVRDFQNLPGLPVENWMTPP